MEKERTRRTMNLFSGNKTEAKKMLAIYFRNLYLKIKRYGLTS